MINIFFKYFIVVSIIFFFSCYVNILMKKVVDLLMQTLKGLYAVKDKHVQGNINCDKCHP